MARGETDMAHHEAGRAAQTEMIEIRHIEVRERVRRFRQELADRLATSIKEYGIFGAPRAVEQSKRANDGPRSLVCVCTAWPP